MRTRFPPEKDALIVALWNQAAAVIERLAALEAKLDEPPKTPDNSSVPPSKGQKANRAASSKPEGPHRGSLGRKGGGRSLMQEPDRVVSAKAATCQHCSAALREDTHQLHTRLKKIDLPPVRPVVTRVERCAGHCTCCGGTTLPPA